MRNPLSSQWASDLRAQMSTFTEPWLGGADALADMHASERQAAELFSHPDAVYRYAYVRQTQLAPSEALVDAVKTVTGNGKLKAADPYDVQERALIDRTVRLCQQRDIFPPPSIFVVDSKKVNAASVSGTHMVVTRGAMEAFPDAQFDAVIGHELSHHRHAGRDMGIRAGTALGALGVVGAGWYKASKAVERIVHKAHEKLGHMRWANTKILAGEVALFVLALPAVKMVYGLLQNPHKHYMEYEADREGAELTSPETMKETLHTLTRENDKVKAELKAKKEQTPSPVIDTKGLKHKVRNFMRNPLGSHPATEKRIAALDKLPSAHVSDQASDDMRFANAEDQRQKRAAAMVETAAL